MTTHPQEARLTAAECEQVSCIRDNMKRNQNNFENAYADRIALLAIIDRLTAPHSTTEAMETGEATARMPGTVEVCSAYRHEYCGFHGHERPCELSADTCPFKSANKWRKEMSNDYLDGPGRAVGDPQFTPPQPKEWPEAWMRAVMDAPYDMMLDDVTNARAILGALSRVGALSQQPSREKLAKWLKDTYRHENLRFVGFDFDQDADTLLSALASGDLAK